MKPINDHSVKLFLTSNAAEDFLEHFGEDLKEMDKFEFNHFLGKTIEQQEQTVVQEHVLNKKTEEWLVKAAKGNAYGLLSFISSALSITIAQFANTEQILLNIEGIEQDIEVPFPLVCRPAENLNLRAYVKSVASKIALARQYAKVPVQGVAQALHGHAFSTNVGIGFLNSGKTVGEQYDLFLTLHPEKDRVFLSLHYKNGFINEIGRALLLEKLEEVLRQIPVEPCILANLKTVKETKRTTVLASLKGEEVELPDVSSAYELFEKIKNKTPEAIAISLEDEAWSYETLASYADGLSSYMQTEMGVKKGDVVGVLLPKSHLTVVSMLAIFNAGAVYLPIDPEYPQERIDHIIEDSETKFLLVHSSFFMKISKYFHLKNCALDLQIEAILKTKKVPKVEVQVDAASYLIYTSGSTGKPKGTLLRHKGFINLVQAQIRTFGIENTDVVGWFSSPSFDASLSEVFMALACGAQLVVLSKKVTMDPIQFQSKVKKENITVLTLPPYYIAGLENSTLTQLRVLISAGEAAKVRDAEKLKDKLHFFNAYGPTEYSVCISMHKANPEQQYADYIPIGAVIDNAQVYLLGEDNQQVAQGVPGEICVSGPGTALGYINNTELTEQKFCPTPVDEKKLMYRTGDIGVLDANNQLVCIGRKDHQVKLRGFRIELGEIENVLRKQTSIQEAVVLVKSQNDQAQLIAYYQNAKNEKTSSETLRNYMQEHLPDYMVPNRFIPMEAFPVNTHGKIDRNQLPDLDSLEKEEIKEKVAPTNATQSTLVSLWSDILEREDIGIEDNFFEMGGHSLFATQIVTRINTHFEVSMELTQFFDHPTVKEQEVLLQELLKKDKTENAMPLVKANREKKIPLSFAQTRMWVLDQFEEVGSAYHIGVGLRFEGQLEVEKLEKSIQKVVDRQEALRTVFLQEEDGTPYQKVLPEVNIPLEKLPLTSTAPIEVTIKELLQKPFDLTNGPLLRVYIAQNGVQNYQVIFTVHHIIADGWSLGLLVKEISAQYKLLKIGGPSYIKPFEIQYPDFSVWQQEWFTSQAMEKQKQFWMDTLQGMPDFLPLPYDFPRPAVQTYDGDLLRLQVNAELSEKIRAFCKKEDLTQFTFLSGAFSLLLHAYSQEKELVIGTPIANRSKKELEPLIGLFLNMLPLRSSVAENTTYRSYFEKYKAMVLGAFTHQDIPFEKLVEALDVPRSTSYSPIFQVMFTLHNNPIPSFSLPGLTVESIPFKSGKVKFDLNVSFEDREEGFEAVWQYNERLFGAETIAQMSSQLLVLIEHICGAMEQPVSATHLISKEEKKELLANRREGPEIPNNKGIHTLVEAHVELEPAKKAYIFGEAHVSYKALNQQANQMARTMQSKLVHLGLPPTGNIVAIGMERGIPMGVVLLSILKSGNVYLPLDTSHPEDRLQYILEDASAALLVTDTSSKSYFTKVPEESQLVYEQIEASLALESKENLKGHIEAGQLAYLIYTSGSTGKPKGTKISHANVLNFFDGMNNAITPQNKDAVWAASTTLAFDISVLELLWTLSNGNSVVLLPNSIYNSSATTQGAGPATPLDFSLFYFSATENTNNPDKDAYYLLKKGAKFADKNGFKAVWTPERHFHAFGGLFPNPSLTSTMLASITKNIDIRCGSVVAGLHHPTRIAEEWSFVDTISGGRAGMAFASGWQINDFVIRPEGYENRHTKVLETIETVQKLWKGHKVPFVNPAGDLIETEIFPKPIHGSIPIWITSANSVETVRSAGKAGHHLLTHLLGQSIEELQQKIEAYRAAWNAAGHAGEGTVTLMLHTFIGLDKEAVKAKVKTPFKDYLKSSIGLIRNLAKSIGKDIDSSNFSTEDLDAVLEFAFDRYFETSALFGTPESALPLLSKLSSIGVNEIGCLIDFGVEDQQVLDGLQHLAALKENYAKQLETVAEFSLAKTFEQHKVSHFQCTPSLMEMLLVDQENKAAFKNLNTLLLGGESLPLSLTQQIHQTLDVSLYNMYGPTETTIWSSVSKISPEVNKIDLGTPISNTQLLVLDEKMQLVPKGIAGELHIGGKGVGHGYHNQPELTAKRFVENPYSEGETLYKTGDLVGYTAEGKLRYIGRNDFQVKLNGRRIELMEIEAVVLGLKAVKEAICFVKQGRLAVCFVATKLLETPVLQQEMSSKLPEYMVPVLWRQVEAMPLTPNGKIDRKSIANQGFEVAELEASEVKMELPTTPIEKTLFEIWKAALGYDNFGIHHNFFQVGGQSLLAVKVMGEVKASFGKNLPLALLFQYSTIQKMAEIIEKSTENSEGTLLRWAERANLFLLQDGPEHKAPIFLIPGSSGTPFYLQHLAQSLAKDRKVYGFQYHGMDGESAPLKTIDAIAELFVQEMQEIQPEGPYHLVGHSLGGVVAFEMANLLKENIGILPTLSILEKDTPLKSEKEQHRSAMDWFEEIVYTAQNLSKNKVETPDFEKIARLSEEEQTKVAIAILRNTGLVPSEMEDKKVFQFLHVIQTNLMAEYKRTEFNAIPIQLIRAKSLFDLNATPIEDAIVLENWKKLIGKDTAIELQTVEGDHYSMFSETHVAALAEVLIHKIKENSKQLIKD